MDIAGIVNRGQLTVMRHGKVERGPDHDGRLPDGKLDVTMPTTSPAAQWKVAKYHEELVYLQTLRAGIQPTHMEFMRKDGQYVMALGFQCVPSNAAHLL